MNLGSREFYQSKLFFTIIVSTGVVTALLLLKLALSNRQTGDLLLSSGALLSNTGGESVDAGGLNTPTPTLGFQAAVLDNPAPVNNCTYTSDYWRDHPESWMTDNIVIGQYTFSKGEALQILDGENEDLAIQLQKQFLTAILNILNGADPGVVEPVLQEASQWIRAHPPQIDISEAERRRGQELAQWIADFNNGVAGPALCPDQPFTLTPTPTQILTATAGPTLNWLLFISPTYTPTNTPSANGPLLPTPTAIILPGIFPSATTPVYEFPISPTSAPLATLAPTNTRSAPTATPTFWFVPPSDTPQPATSTLRPPTSTTRPFTPTSPPATSAPQLSTSTPQPPTLVPQPTNLPPATSTPVPPRNTPRPTNTPKPTKTDRPTEAPPATSTPLPPATNTPLPPPTSTPLPPPSDTPLPPPPTDTPLPPPTDTPLPPPPTDTPLPPTPADTPEPTGDTPLPTTTVAIIPAVSRENPAIKLGLL